MIYSNEVDIACDLKIAVPDKSSIWGYVLVEYIKGAVKRRKRINPV